MDSRAWRAAQRPALRCGRAEADPRCRRRARRRAQGATMLPGCIPGTSARRAECCDPEVGNPHEPAAGQVRQEIRAVDDRPGDSREGAVHRHGAAARQDGAGRDGRTRLEEPDLGRKPRGLKLGADRRAWIEDDGGGRPAAAGEFKEAAHEGGNDEADGLGPASRQKKHRPRGVVAHGRGVVRGHERVADELHGKARVRVAPNLEGEDHREGVQVAGHLEAAARPRGPDLGADVIEGPHAAPSLQAYAAQPERLRDAQVDPRVVDKADGGGTVAGDPADGLVDERPEEGEVPENLREADH